MAKLEQIFTLSATAILEYQICILEQLFAVQRFLKIHYNKFVLLSNSDYLVKAVMLMTGLLRIPSVG